MQARTLYLLAAALSLVGAPVALADDPDEPTCSPSTDHPGAEVCWPPAACEGHLYETPECTPPSFCEDLGDGSFLCRFDQAPGPGDHGGHDAPAHDEHDGDADHDAACRPAEGHHHALVCHPPRVCEGRLYETPDCTPPPECEPLGDGTFLCTLPQPTAYPHAPDAALPHGGLELGPDDLVLELLRDELHLIVEEARAELKASLAAFSETYHAETDALRDHYYAERDALKDAYFACRDAAVGDAEARLACLTEARDGHDALLEQVLADHAAMREGLIAEADAVRAATCATVEGAIQDAIAAIAPGVPAEAFLGAGDIAFCDRARGGAH